MEKFPWRTAFSLGKLQAKQRFQVSGSDFLISFFRKLQHIQFQFLNFRVLEG